MEVYVVANIKTNTNLSRGYRLVDIEGKSGVEIKDVTKQQLVHVLKNKILKVENAKRNGQTVMGIYSSLDKFGTLICGSNITEIANLCDNKLVILKQLIHNDEIIGAYISNPKGDVKKVSIGELKRICLTSNVVNATFQNGVLDIKAKRQEIELEKPKNEYVDIISDEEARDRYCEWTIPRFMKYMEQHNYSYEIRDLNNNVIRDNSITFIEDKYEKLNNKTYFKLSNIDKRCKILHVPVGITSLENLWEYNNQTIEMDTVVISKTVTSASEVISKASTNLVRLSGAGVNLDTFRWIQTDRFWMQEWQDEDNIELNRNLSGFWYMTILKDYSIAATGRLSDSIVFKDLFNRCTLPYIPRFNKYEKNVKLTSSFNKIILNGINRSVDFTNLYEVQSSFMGITGIERVVIGNTTSSIHSIFRVDAGDEDIYINPEVEFKSNSLVQITNSFKHTKNYDEYSVIDLSEAVKLYTLSSSFMSEDIEEIILPDSLTVIANGNCMNMKIGKKVILPESIRRFDFTSFRCSEVDNLDWSKSQLNVLSSHLASYCEADDLIISDNFIKLSMKTFESSYIQRIQQANNIETLGTEVFGSSSLLSFDSRIMPKLKILPSKTFYNCSRLRTVILGEGIKSVADDVFIGCKTLSNVVISDTVKELSSTLFRQAAKDSGIIKVFTITNSEAHQKFKNKKNILLFTFDTFEEAVEALNGASTATDNQKNKFKMIMASNEEFKELLVEPYLSNCQRIMTMVKEYKSDVTKESVLDTSKLDLNGRYIGEILDTKNMDLLANIRSQLNETLGEDKNRLGIRFMHYCNLLTSIGNNHTSIFRAENSKMLKASVINLQRISYIDYRGAILIISIKHVNNIANNLAVITIDNKIVWASMFTDGDTSPIISKRNCVLSNYYLSSTDALKQRENNLGSYINIGDTHSKYGGSTLNSCALPESSKYKNLWEYMLYNDMIMLGVDKVKSLNKVSGYDKDLNCTLTWLNLTTGKIITTSQNVTIEPEGTSSYFGSYMKINRYSEITVTGIFEAQDVVKGAKSKLYNITELLDAFNNSNVDTYSKLLISTDKDLDSIAKSEGAYDKSELKTPTLELLAKTFNEYKVQNEGQLTKSAAIALLSCGLCEELKMSLNKAFEKFGNPDMVPIYGNQDVIMKFEISDKVKSKQNYKYIYAVTNLLDNSKSVKLYMSKLDIRTLISKVRSLDFELKGKPLYEIQDEPINVDDFTFFSCKTKRFRYAETCKLEVAIQHKTMEVFLVGNFDDIDYFTLYRFRNFKDAEEVLLEYEDKDEDIQGCRNIDGGTSFYKCNDFISALVFLTDAIRKSRNPHYVLDDSEKYTDLYTIREYIKRGLPNNYPVLMYKKDLLDKLAKQPAKHA